MKGKQHKLASLAAHLGVTRLLERLPRSPSLLILNYHRIGEAANTPFDSGVFSCNAQDLERHVRYLQRQFRIVSLPDALDLLDGRRTTTDPTLLLTFDDGYLDNFHLAFPILARHGVPATFFLPTAFIGTGQLPWWDTIASIVKRSRKSTISPRFTPARTFDLAPSARDHTVQQLHDLYKSSPIETERFLVDLEDACDVSRTAEVSTPLFLSWDEARTMQAAGMSFGSHTHTHRILARLPLAEQSEELRTSREILEHELSHPVHTFAYPVGDRSSFNADTLRALTETGYRHAFSFISGVNRLHPGRPSNPYTVLRSGVFSGSLPVLRLRSSLQAFSSAAPVHFPPALTSHLSARA